MKNGKTFLAIIPARGGSKRLPRKNILDLAGKPLIAWTIKAALNSKYIDRVLVTSDDSDILKLSKSFGASIIKRPIELALDSSSSFDSIKHSIVNSEKYDYIVLLQPTSPLRTETNIDEAIELLYAKKADGIVSVTKAEHSPLWSNILPEDGDMKNFISPQNKNKRSQDLPIQYKLNGAIYICNTDRLLLESTFFIKDKIYAYEMDRQNSIDIDDEIDFELSKILIKKMKTS